MQMLELTRDQWAILDDEDIEWAFQWKWRSLGPYDTGDFYAIRSERVLGSKPSRTITFRLHCEIARRMGLDMSLLIDHKNGDTLDDRRDNLRALTSSESQVNRRLPSDNKSGCLGVLYVEKYKHWIARITVNKRIIHLGAFPTFDMAVFARKCAEVEYFGDLVRQPVKPYELIAPVGWDDMLKAHNKSKNGTGCRVCMMIKDPAEAIEAHRQANGFTTPIHSKTLANMNTSVRSQKE
jgi:hypothetical protein